MINIVQCDEVIASILEVLLKETETLTVKEVSQELGIGINQTYAACERGQIPCMRFGRRWIIPRLAFKRWLSTCGFHSVFREDVCYKEVGHETAQSD